MKANLSALQYYQQGDVIIEKVSLTDDEKKGLEKIQTKPLAEGETTGHAHRVTSGTFQMFKTWSDIFLEAKTECVVTHEEHGATTVAPGLYKIGRVQEYDHFAEEARNVRD